MISVTGAKSVSGSKGCFAYRCGFVEKLDTREGGRTRVRAGPFATREAAESARERVRGLGFPDAAVVGR